MIKAEHLSKAFGEIKAVDNIDIEIPDNSIFGLAGTNGAGKSTFCASFVRCSETGSGEC